MKIIRTYKIELNPNNTQSTLLLKHAGVARFAYNWGLNEKKKAIETKQKIPNSIELSKRLAKLKSTEFPWMYEVSSCAPLCALQNLDRAFDNFFKQLKLKRSGNYTGKIGFPRFKLKHKANKSFKLVGRIKINTDSITLPRIGQLRLKESNYINSGTKVLSTIIKEKAGKWFVSINVEEEISIPVNKPEAIIGIDLGVSTLITCSDGQKFDNKRPLRNQLRKLCRLQQHINRKPKGSKNRQKAIRKTAKLHFKIANQRRDYLHKITTHLTKTKSRIVIEDLNVKGMMKNHSLAQAIGDASFSEIRQQLTYKGRWHGCEIIIANRFYPSSKICSDCNHINQAISLKDRKWICEKCGSYHDRDENASTNLYKLADSLSESINSPMETEALAMIPSHHETTVNEIGIKQGVGELSQFPSVL